MKVLAVIVIFVVSVNAVITRIVDWPNYNSFPQCAKNALGLNGVFEALRCGAAQVCVCNRYTEALSLVQSIAATKLNCPESGVFSATSLISGFCHQLPSVTFSFTDVPLSTAVTTSSSATPAASVTGTAAVTSLPNTS